MAGTHYDRSLKGFQILSGAIEQMKWQAFRQCHNEDEFQEAIDSLNSFAKALADKDKERSKEEYNFCVSKMTNLREKYLEFSEKCSSNSATCQYWDGIIKLCQMMKNLVAEDRNSDWEAHLQSVQDLLPVFRECDSLNYLRYASWYLEKMRMLKEEYPSIYDQFMQGNFVLQTEPGGFKANSPDMRLEQTIQRSKKSSGGIIGQTRQEEYVTEWELVYHEILAISNCFSDLTQSKEACRLFGHHELFGSSAQKFNGAVQKVSDFISARGNPYSGSISSQLHNFTSGQS